MGSLRNILVTNRTQTDVNRAKYLISLFDAQGIWHGTQEERAELEENHGIYTPADVNRVLRAVSYVAARLEGYGYAFSFDYYPAYLISVSVEPAGGGTAAGDLRYQGEEAKVRAVPADEYVFDGWYESGEKISEEPVYTFSADRNRNLTAKFTALTTTTRFIPRGQEEAMRLADGRELFVKR